MIEEVHDHGYVNPIMILTMKMVPHARNLPYDADVFPCLLILANMEQY